MNIFNNAKIQLIKKSLNVYEKQHEAIAKNIAHAHDLNYKPEKTDFSDELEQSMVQRLKRTDPRHLEPSGNYGKAELPGQEPEHVDVSKEMGQLAVNQIRFDFSTNVLRRSYKALNTSITGKVS